ncbi:Protein of unknown function [Arsukibacterium tuosuense]|uniref:DUF3718 domain-containing protein n=1 Tax=Arsukibacterium tuosuense TaxID=1323745 RepID=A0A285J0T4_9GAMM|nr:DUF3718 domain-containing protein [Arsukibacterium tuosuense]SNY53940.1 Protein of unknown function [Arsukibacterium tuosuense]
MKTALFFAVSLASTSMVVTAADYSFSEDRYVHNALVQVCTETADDDRRSLQRTLREYRISKQNAVKKIVCNGKQLMDFARANQAVRVTAMLQPYEDRIKGRVTIHDVAAPAAN